MSCKEIYVWYINCTVNKLHLCFFFMLFLLQELEKEKSTIRMLRVIPGQILSADTNTFVALAEEIKLHR